MYQGSCHRRKRQNREIINLSAIAAPTGKMLPAPLFTSVDKREGLLYRVAN